MRNQAFDKLLDGIKELHDKKNHDYAEDGNPYSNFEFASKIVKEFSNPVDQVFAGIVGIKLARLGQLKGKGKTPNNESVIDTMRDLTTYCAIWTARTIEWDELLAPSQEVESPLKDKMDTLRIDYG